MKPIFSLFMLSLTVLPFGCSEATDTTVAESADPVTKSEVFDACLGYCERVAACDERIDGPSCAAACESVAEQAVIKQCEATLQAALECVDRNFCEQGYPIDSAPDAEPKHRCGMKAAALTCTISTPPDLAPAFEFFGTGRGIAPYMTGGWNDVGSCALEGTQDPYFDGSFEVRCAESGDAYACSCFIDDRVTKTIEADNVCPAADIYSFEGLIRECGWRYWQ